MRNELVTIASFENNFEAEIAKTFLEDNGFQVFLQNEMMMSVLPGLAGEMCKIELQVFEEDAEHAKDLLNSCDDDSVVSELLKAEQAVLEGHFLLTSGRHSDRYIEKIRILQNPSTAMKLCQRMASRLSGYSFDAVVGPAYGGIALAFGVAYLLEKPFLFTQRMDEKMSIRSGFDLSGIKRVALVEDIVTTGSSIFEVIKCLADRGIETVVIGAIVDRSGGEVDFSLPFKALLSLSLQSWEADMCPLCQQGIELVKPGSSDKRK